MNDQDVNRIIRNFVKISEEDATDLETAFAYSQSGLSKSLDWIELLKSKRIIIVSEAGAGKTYECREEQKRLWELGEPSFYFELAELSTNNIEDLLSCEEENRFAHWINSSEIATIFLDSIDELKLTKGSFRTALNRISKAISGNLGRVKVVITSRPTTFDLSQINSYLSPPSEENEPIFDEDSFADIAMGEHKRQRKNKEERGPDSLVVSLLPLSNKQIAQIAKLQGIANVDELLENIRKHGAEDFTRRPQDLIELCTDWRDHNEFRTHREQVAYNIKTKLKARTDRKEGASLSEDKALDGARRLALAALLTKKLTLRHS